MASFTDLRVWQLAHQASLSIYKATNSFPSSEQFGLTSQMRRAIVSVSSNIAEGYGRSTEKDREHFYTIASGSLYELKSQLMVAHDIKYLTKLPFRKRLHYLTTLTSHYTHCYVLTVQATVSSHSCPMSTIYCPPSNHTLKRNSTTSPGCMT